MVIDTINNEKASYSCIKDFAQKINLSTEYCQGCKYRGSLAKGRYYIENQARALENDSEKQSERNDKSISV